MSLPRRPRRRTSRPAEETLKNVAVALAKTHPSSKIIVQGYTDAQGSLAYNEALSQNRAETVRAYLVSHGVPADRLTATGFGPRNPVATNDTVEGRANDRRVEIVVTPVAESVEAVPTSTRSETTTTIH
jgi:OOP family OmpA-OmpF porin